MKKIIPIGTVFVVALVVFFAFHGNNAPTAYAEQIAQKSLTSFQALTPIQQQELEQKVQANLETVLQEAKQAKDLQTLTYEQFKATFPKTRPAGSQLISKPAATVNSTGNTQDVSVPQLTPSGTALPDVSTIKPGTAIPDPSVKPLTKDLESATFLKFTDHSGNTVAIAIAKDETLPFMVITTSPDGINGTATIRFPKADTK